MDWGRDILTAPRVTWAIPAVIIVLIGILSLDAYLPGWKFGAARNSFAAVDSIDAHGSSVALLRENESKTTVIWLYQNEEGEDDAAATNLRNRVLLFSLLAFAAGTTVFAAQKNPESVQVTIGTILASNQNDDFDPKLKSMEKQLKVLKYRSYRLLKNDTQKVPWQGSKVFEIPGGRSLTVTPQEFQDNRISLKVRLTQGEKPLLDTTVKIPNKGNFILGGPPHEGGTLVLSISAAAQ